MINQNYIHGIIRNDFGHCYYAFEQDYVHIYNLIVLPEYRRQGKARELLQATIDEIRRKGYKGNIQIVAKPQDDSISLEKLKSFYKDMGLEVFEYYG
jgi:ribosomal protein S18 acetylase RimI-like enzyme